MSSNATHYKAYLAAYEDTSDADHHATYVDSVPNQDGDPRSLSSGWLSQVTGSMLSGMSFEDKEVKRNPIFSMDCNHMTPIGWVSHDKFHDEVKAVCLRIPPPHKQFTLARRIFPNTPIRHCQHWARDAMHALCATGVLEPLTSSDDKATLYRIN